MVQRGEWKAVDNKHDGDQNEDRDVGPRLIFHEQVDPVIAEDRQQQEGSRHEDHPEREVAADDSLESLPSQQDVESGEGDVHRPYQHQNQQGPVIAELSTALNHLG